MTDLQAIIDRVEIETLRGEFTDAVLLRDYDRAASLFTEDGDIASGRAYLQEVIRLRERVYEVRYHDTSPLAGSAPRH